MANVDELYSDALSLAKAFDDNFIDLGKTIRSLHETDSNRFNDFITASGISRRSAYYLIGIDKAFRALKVPKKTLIELGFTKLSVLHTTITKQNKDELLEYAKNHTVAEIKKYLRGEEVGDNSKAVLMYFSPEDYGKLVDVLLKNGAQKSGRGLVNKEEALMNLLAKKE